MHQASLAQQGDAIAGLLDLGDHMRRKQDRPPRLPRFDHQGDDFAAHADIEIRGRLVENHQRRVGGERSGQGQLVLHAGGKLGDAAREVQVEPLGQCDRARIARLAAHVGEKSQHLATIHLGKHPHLAGQIGDAATHVERSSMAIETVDSRRPGGRPQISEQQPEERRFPGAVRAQQPQDLAASDLQIAAIEGHDRAVTLRQRSGANDHGAGGLDVGREWRLRAADGRVRLRGRSGCVGLASLESAPFRILWAPRRFAKSKRAFRRQAQGGHSDGGTVLRAGCRGVPILLLIAIAIPISVIVIVVIVIVIFVVACPLRRHICRGR